MSGLSAAVRRQAGWLPEGALVAGVLSGFAARNGGAFPPEWSWGAIVFALVAAIAIARRRRLELGPAEWLFVGGLCLLCCWTWLSLLWAADSSRAMLEGQRTLLYALGALALVTVARRSALGPVVGALLAVTAGICCAALAVRLFPERFGVIDPIAENRLAEPLGYWNALGFVAAIGAVLAVGVVARGRHPLARAGAGAVAVLATTTIYFTFSRGAWVALALGLVAALAAPGRLRIAAAALVLAVPSAGSVALASQQGALKTRDAAIEQASLQGHRIAVAVVLLALAAAGLAALAGWLARGRELTAGARRAGNAALLGTAVAAVVAALVAGGGPARLADRAVDAFSAAPTNVGPDVSKRLLSFNGSYRTEMWRVAADAVADEPVLGIGAGSYGRRWLAERPVDYFVRDAHSLYLETLSELGPLGLALLLAALVAPLLGYRRARRHPLAAVALGAYVAFLAHAAIDWDWELPSLTLSALLLGGALLAAGRAEAGEAPATTRRIPAHTGRAARARLGLAGALVLLVGLLSFFLGGNLAFDTADAAAHEGRARAAVAPARDAVGWQPWSADALLLLGRVEFASGAFAAATGHIESAARRDPRNPEAQLALATVVTGAARQQALAEARRLDPLIDISGFGPRVP